MMGSGSLFSNGLNGFCGERKQMPRCGHQPCTPAAPQLHPAPLNSRKDISPLPSSLELDVGLQSNPQSMLMFRLLKIGDLS